MDQQGDGTTGVSRRQALGYAGAAAVAGAAGSGLLGAGAAHAEGGPVEQRSVSLAQAEVVLSAALRYVRTNGLPAMYVVVVDVCGDEKASRRMDGNGAASVVLAPLKARTAAAFRTATASLAAGVTDPARIASFTTAGFSLLGGGVPILHQGGVIGAVGVGGGSPEQDALVAQAGVDAL